MAKTDMSYDQLVPFVANKVITAAEENNLGRAEDLCFKLFNELRLPERNQKQKQLVDESLEMINAAGGKAQAVYVDIKRFFDVPQAA